MTNTVNVSVQASSTEQHAMTLAEARQVVWIKDNARPMGELFDEGYLTVDRLNWTAQYAYSRRMRDAAVLLLGGAESPRPTELIPAAVRTGSPITPMTIEAARRVKWPFRDVKGRSMGDLLDQRLLTLKDLGYAVENAGERPVRQAAVTLMLDRLAQAEPPAGPLRVVRSERRSFSEYRQLQIVLVQGILLGVGIVVFLVSTGWWLWKYVPVWQDPATITRFLSPSGLLAVSIIVIACWLMDRLAKYASTRLGDRFETELRANRLGQLGEERVAEALRAHLDSDWTLYRNIILPGRKGGDLDAVLVGPTGIWALEIKNYTGAYRYVRNRWECQTKRGWVSARSRPSDQVRRNATRLHDFLEADDIAQYVKGVVVWANPDSPIEVADSDTPVWRLDRLEEPLAVARSRSAFPPERLTRIHAKLERLTLADPE